MIKMVNVVIHVVSLQHVFFLNTSPCFNTVKKYCWFNLKKNIVGLT